MRIDRGKVVNLIDLWLDLLSSHGQRRNQWNRWNLIGDRVGGTGLVARW
jgi:hypothetical protein